MESQKIQLNQSGYSVFSLCLDFRQRMEQLHRLTEKMLDSNSKEDEITD
jgi:hypothetical protein